LIPLNQQQQKIMLFLAAFRSQNNNANKNKAKLMITTEKKGSFCGCSGGSATSTKMMLASLMILAVVLIVCESSTTSVSAAIPLGIHAIDSIPALRTSPSAIVNVNTEGLRALMDEMVRNDFSASGSGGDSSGSGEQQRLGGGLLQRDRLLRRLSSRTGNSRAFYQPRFSFLDGAGQRAQYGLVCIMQD
jgi:hypothetical protein